MARDPSQGSQKKVAIALALASKAAGNVDDLTSIASVSVLVVEDVAEYICRIYLFWGSRGFKTASRRAAEPPDFMLTHLMTSPDVERRYDDQCV